MLLAIVHDSTLNLVDFFFIETIRNVDSSRANDAQMPSHLPEDKSPLTIVKPLPIHKKYQCTPSEEYSRSKHYRVILSQVLY
jgi:hypothetical protein